MDFVGAILQPGYLPWMGYFDQIARSDVFVHYDDVQFDKHGWRNRNQIKSNTGEAQWLTVPIFTKGKGKPLVKDIQINNETSWRRKHAGTIKQFYKDAPFFSQYWPELEELYHKEWDSLIDLDLAIVDWFLPHLNINTKTVRASELDIQGEQTERLVKICQQLKVNKYLSGDAAKDYLKLDSFSDSNITVEWQDYKHPEYTQLHGNFVPFLSTLDLLFNIGPDGQQFFQKP